MVNKRGGIEICAKREVVKLKTRKKSFVFKGGGIFSPEPKVDYFTVISQVSKLPELNAELRRSNRVFSHNLASFHIYF